MHGNIGDQDIVEVTFRSIPRAGLQVDAGKHVVAVRRAVRVDAGTIEQAVVDDKVGGRPDQPDPIARGVDNAPGNQRVVPIPASDRVVSGKELTSNDAYVSAGPIRPTAEM